MKSRPPDGSLALSIRPLLSSDSSNLRREALSALGNLHDGESVEEILTLLGGGHAGVAGNAHWALRRISGLNLPHDPIRWKLWLTAERSWWEQEGRHLLEALENGDPELLLRAMHQASLHRLYRAQFAPLLEEYAESTDPEIRAAAMLALGRLGLGPDRAPAIPGGGAMSSLQPVPASELLAALDSPRKERSEPAPPEDSSLVLLLLGLPICLSLLVKVSGLAPVARFRSWLADRGEQPGAMIVKLNRRSRRNRPRPS